ncbi:hypothetical protein Hanom_Chr06g00527961 [Helianthus anomalus]
MLAQLLRPSPRMKTKRKKKKKKKKKNLLKKTHEKKGVEFKDPKEPAQKKTKFVIKPLKSAELEVEKEKKKAAEKPIEKEKEQEKKKVAEKPEGDKSEQTGATATVAHEKAQGPEVMRITGLDQPLLEKKKETTRGKGPEVVKPTKPAQVDALTQTAQVTSAAGGSVAAAHKEATTDVGGAGAGVNVLSSAFAAGQAGAGSQSSMPHPPIGPKPTLGDIYYKTYIEEACDDAPHHPPWGLKQKDTFLEFSPCRDWFLNSFPPGEVNRQRAQTHDGLYHAYIVIGERLLRQVKDFEKAKAAFSVDKAKFEADRKSEEWGREGLRGKLRAVEDLLAKERADWKEICKKDNQRMYAARAKITELEAQNATLTKKVELKAQVASKDKDMHAKDVEIAELKRRLCEQTDKSESLEIDLEAQTVKAATVEEAK